MSKKLGIWVCDMGSICCHKETKIMSKQLSEIVGTDCWYHSIPTLKASVYGKRDGCITGLAITHNSRNQFHGTRGWKTGVVHDISMLPRSEMFKPDVLGFTFSKIFQHVFLSPASLDPANISLASTAWKGIISFKGASNASSRKGVYRCPGMQASAWVCVQESIFLMPTKVFKP